MRMTSKGSITLRFLKPRSRLKLFAINFWIQGRILHLKRSFRLSVTYCWCRRRKALGYEVRCVYVLTIDVNINIARVKERHAFGGHDVPEDKIRSRYRKALGLIPEVAAVCDIFFLYDNSVRLLCPCRNTPYLCFWPKLLFKGITLKLLIYTLWIVV